MSLRIVAFVVSASWRVVARMGRVVVRRRWRVRVRPMPLLEGHMNIQGEDIFFAVFHVAFWDGCRWVVFCGL